MRASSGTWHQGFIHPHDDEAYGFQLWVALPPGVEDGMPEGIYVRPREVPQVGNVRVLLGRYEDHMNPIPSPSPIVYLDVVLGAGETFRFAPPQAHTIAFAFVYRGSARVCGEEVAGELVVLNESEEEIGIDALGPARILFGSARKHQHPLVLGSHSVHTNAESLRQGVANIRSIGEELRRAGRM